MWAIEGLLKLEKKNSGCTEFKYLSVDHTSKLLAAAGSIGAVECLLLLEPERDKKSNIVQVIGKLGQHDT